ncbi:anti-repressor SinI family protein [Oceanobacillus sp. FSL W8-0428]|nr:anti-repressor SinI family protein [Oceanobacillus sojae]
MNNEVAREKLDKEWVELIKEALKMGIAMEEIRQFLKKN